MKRLNAAQKARSQQRWDGLIALLGLSDLLSRSPKRLSGGERQRVAIARAVLSAPDILLMDEPLSALDLTAKHEILSYLERLKDELSIPVLYVTHALDEAARLADHMVVLEKGRVRACGPIGEIMARLDLPMAHADDAGVAIKATITGIDSKWHLACATFEGGRLWVRDPGRSLGTVVRLLIKARDVSLALEPNQASSIMNCLPAMVRNVADGDHPSVKLVRVTLGETPVIARLTARSVDQLSLHQGQRLFAQIKSVAIIE